MFLNEQFFHTEQNINNRIIINLTKKNLNSNEINVKRLFV